MSWTIQTDNIKYEKEEASESFKDTSHKNSWVVEEEIPPPTVDPYMQIKKLNKVQTFVSGFDANELNVDNNPEDALETGSQRSYFTGLGGLKRKPKNKVKKEYEFKQVALHEDEETGEEVDLIN